jgi:hypothetical protein
MLSVWTGVPGSWDTYLGEHCEEPHPISGVMKYPDLETLQPRGTYIELIVPLLKDGEEIQLGENTYRVTRNGRIRVNRITHWIPEYTPVYQWVTDPLLSKMTRDFRRAPEALRNKTIGLVVLAFKLAHDIRFEKLAQAIINKEPDFEVRRFREACSISRFWMKWTEKTLLGKPSTWRFCPRCGEPLTRFAPNGAGTAACDSCHMYWNDEDPMWNDPGPGQNI